MKMTRNICLRLAGDRGVADMIIGSRQTSFLSKCATIKRQASLSQPDETRRKDVFEVKRKANISRANQTYY